MKQLKGKKLLILGGTYASLDVVKIARSMGIFVIVTDDAPKEQRISKQIADDSRNISTDDMEDLLRLIKEEHIDGVFCGPSEFNLRNTIHLCALAGLPCYATEELWNRCANKTEFKQYCIACGVDTPKTYPLSVFDTEGADRKVVYPVAVKPADASSSRGITVCYCREQVKDAVNRAKTVSSSGNVFIEQYLDNGGRLFNVRYILDEGKAFPYLAIDTFIADPTEKKHLISALSRYPSSLTNLYMHTADLRVRKMIKEMGLKNGTVFIQMIPKNGKFYCMDMGYRLSGGLFYKLTEPLMGINDVKMMIRYALGGKMCEKDELRRIFEPRSASFAQLTTPLRPGRIKEIRGMDVIEQDPRVIDILQYYREVDEITPSAVGTLAQHFSRISFLADTEKEVIDAVNTAQNALSVLDGNGNEMYVMRFDTDARLGD